MAKKTRELKYLCSICSENHKNNQPAILYKNATFEAIKNNIINQPFYIVTNTNGQNQQLRGRVTFLP